MKIRKILIITISILILILFGIVSSISYNTGMKYGVKNAESIRITNAKTSEAHKQNPKSVLVRKVNNSKIKTLINSSGRAVSRNNITISSEVQGRLVGESKFKKGTEINKNEIIFSVKDTDLKLMIESKKSRLISLISSTLADIQLDYDSEYIKWSNFFNAIDLNSELPAFPKTKTTKEKNFITSRSILSEYLSIKSDEERLRKYTVRAPFDGMITKSYSDVGGNVNPGSPVVDFIRKGAMEIELTVNTSEIKFVNIGDVVDFHEDSKKYTGKIIRKGGFVNNNTQNISVFSTINTNEDILYNGMYLNATITTKGTNNVFKLPRRSIFGGNKVFVVDSDNKLMIEDVNIIAYQNDDIIIGGLENETLVVSEPLVNMSKGTMVKTIIK
tara:strand:- start:3001 stop:4161 length:1161 start_codon:yes stop_codon:yes gene_type:complete